MKPDLVLFTSNHPFTHTGGETMFVGPELPHLAQAFHSVRVVPLYDDGLQLPLPDGVGLDRKLARRWHRWRPVHVLRAMLWPGFWAELGRGWALGKLVGLARVWRWTALADATWCWLRQNQTPHAAPMLLYSYWRGGQTLAALRWASDPPTTQVATRVHRYELYDDAFDPPFQPWTAMYGRLARIGAVAQQGADYLLARGVAPDRLRVARLGVWPAVTRARESEDGVWRLVSCSNVVPVKRVDRIAQGVQALARRHPGRRMTWTHFGDGPAMKAVQVSLDAPPDNLTVCLEGQVPHAAVLAHYQTEAVDLLLLLSSSEGLPVSIPEAMAHGIPVLATDVGGVAEAVHRSGDNGALVHADASVNDICRALEVLLLAPPAARAARREVAFDTWQRHFHADRNHAAWAAELAGLFPPH